MRLKMKSKQWNKMDNAEKVEFVASFNGDLLTKYEKWFTEKQRLKVEAHQHCSPGRHTWLSDWLDANIGWSYASIQALKAPSGEVHAVLAMWPSGPSKYMDDMWNKGDLFPTLVPGSMTCKWFVVHE